MAETGTSRLSDILPPVVFAVISDSDFSDHCWRAIGVLCLCMSLTTAAIVNRFPALGTQAAEVWSPDEHDRLKQIAYVGLVTKYGILLCHPAG